MNTAPPGSDPRDEADALYRQASAQDRSRPSEAVRQAVLAHAAKLAAARAPGAERSDRNWWWRVLSQPAWRPALMGTLVSAVLAGLMLPWLFAPEVAPVAGPPAAGLPATASPPASSPAKVPAATLFSGPYYFAEQLGFRKIIDATFMITTMITGQPDPEDVRKFFRALKRAQRDIDLRPDRYTHYYKKEFPARYHAVMDTRRWGPGERIVFEPYTKEVFDETFKWIADHGIFADSGMGTKVYESSIATNAA